LFATEQLAHDRRLVLADRVDRRLVELASRPQDDLVAVERGRDADAV
jgi:hypothetical protein